MKDRKGWNNKQFTLAAAIFITFLFILPALSAASTRTERVTFQRSIVDYRPRLNPRYKKV
jgi:hypothetical protein